MHARVHAGGDEGLDLPAFPAQGMLVESSGSARTSSSCPSKSWAAFGGSVETRRARVASVRASHSVMMDWFGTPKERLKWSTMVDTKRRHMMLLDTKALTAIPNAVRRPSPPQVTPVGGLPPRVVRQVTAERSADRGPQLSVESDQQILVKEVPIDAHVIHELGHVCALPGGDHLRGGLINAANRGAHLVAGSH